MTKKSANFSPGFSKDVDVNKGGQSQPTEARAGSQGRRQNIDFGLATSFNPEHQPVMPEAPPQDAPEPGAAQDGA